MTSYAIQRGQDMANYAAHVTRAILQDDDMPPLRGITGVSGRRFEAWDDETQVLVVGRYAAAVTPEIVAEVTQMADDMADDVEWVGALIVPPTLTLTDEGHTLCGQIIVYQCAITGDGVALTRIE